MISLSSLTDLAPLRIEKGLPVGPDGRVHTVFAHDPATLRLSSKAPNMQNIPRGATELGKLIRRMFVAPPGYTFWARDYAGIEAILVGFLANAPRVMRIYRLDGHSYFTAYATYTLEPGVLKYEDLPQEAWSDADLTECLAGIKKRFKPKRNYYKRLTHGANYRETARMAQIILLNELGVLLPIKDISVVMEFYHELFPEIRRWHETLVAQVSGVDPRCPPQHWGYTAKNCHVTHPFGFSNRYYDTIKWKKTPKGWDWEMGEDANKLVAFMPQSMARFILTRAAQRMFDDPAYDDVASTFRLFIHDEVLGECRSEQVERCLEVSRIEMERPIPELVLPNGSLLTLATEPKVGPIWGDMAE